jgi:hypothetical protein
MTCVGLSALCATRATAQTAGAGGNGGAFVCNNCIIYGTPQGGGGGRGGDASGKGGSTNQNETYSGLVVFELQNNAKYSINLKFYSSPRKHVWEPGTNKHWLLNDSKLYEFKLNCVPGETVCYGASYEYHGDWGVGLKGDRGCEKCCVVCAPRNENTRVKYSLTD